MKLDSFGRVAECFVRTPAFNKGALRPSTNNSHARSDGNDDGHLNRQVTAPRLRVPLQELPEHRVHLHHPLVCPRHVRDGELEIEQNGDDVYGRELAVVPSLEQQQKNGHTTCARS